MFCGKCGSQLPDDANICSTCGAPVKKISQHSDGLGGCLFNGLRLNARKAGNPILYVVYTVVGIVMLCYAFITYSNDTSKFLGGYTYEPPLTDHEVGVIVIGVLGLAFLIGGLIDLSIYFARTRK